MTTRNASLSGLADRDIDEMLAGLDGIVTRLRSARILVTGATGWFGTWLLDALAALDARHDLGLRVVAVSRDPRRFAARHPRLAKAAIVEWVTADVRDAAFTVRGPLTHVIHAATDASAALNSAAPDLMFDTIVDGTRRVLQVAAERGARRVLLLSSGAVYGPQPLAVERLDEAFTGAPDPLLVANAYAEGKRAAEQLAAIARTTHDIEPVIARCFAFVGPHMPLDTHFAIGNFIRDAIERDAIVVKGDGTPLRSYLYMTDLVVWLLTLMVEASPLRAYNVGSDEALSIGDLASHCAEVARAAGRRVPVRVDAHSRAVDGT
jgi:nucleoside-diphosphate-sugar epimerase